MATFIRIVNIQAVGSDLFGLDDMGLTWKLVEKEWRLHAMPPARENPATCVCGYEGGHLIAPTPACPSCGVTWWH